MVLVVGRDEALGQLRVLSAFRSELRPAELAMVVIPVIAIGRPSAALQLSTGEVPLLSLKPPVTVRSHSASIAQPGSQERVPYLRVRSAGPSQPQGEAPGPGPSRTGNHFHQLRAGRTLTGWARLIARVSRTRRSWAIRRMAAKNRWS